MREDRSMSARSFSAGLGIVLALVLGWVLWPSGDDTATVEPVPFGPDEVAHETAELQGGDVLDPSDPNAASSDVGEREQALGGSMDVRIEVWRPRHLNLVPVERGQVTVRRVSNMDLLRWDFEDGVCTRRVPEETYRILLVKIDGAMVDVEDYGLEYLKPDQTEVRLVLAPEPGFLLRAVDAGSGRDLDEVWVVQAGRQQHMMTGRIDLTQQILEKERLGLGFTERASYADRDRMIFPCLPMSLATPRWDPLTSGASPFWVATEDVDEIWVGSPGRGWTQPYKFEEPVDGFEERHAALLPAGSIDVVLAGDLPSGGVTLTLESQAGVVVLAEHFESGQDLLRIEDVPAGDYHLYCKSVQRPWVPVPLGDGTTEVRGNGGQRIRLTGQQGEAGMRVPVAVPPLGRVRVRMDWDEVGRTFGSLHAKLRYPEGGVGYQSLGVQRLEDDQPFHFVRSIKMQSIRSEADPRLHDLELTDVPAGDYLLRLLPLGWQTTVRVESGLVRDVTLDVQPPAQMLILIEEPQGQSPATRYVLRWGYVGEASPAGFTTATTNAPTAIRPAAFPIWIDVEPQTLPEGVDAFTSGGDDPLTEWSHLVERVEVAEAIPGHEVLVIQLPLRDE